jgi:4a-hydroxytetrahydrobiopterin dehydratase
MPTPPLSDAEIVARLSALPGWERDGDLISKTYRTDSYLAGLAFASAIGTLAEAQDHHPELVIGWKRVTVRYNTHDAGGKITEKDIRAAAAIEALGYPRPKV